jgi:hypothetical protein
MAAAHPMSAHPPNHNRQAAESPMSAQATPGKQAMITKIRR